MVKQTIEIFARVKPTKNKTGQYEIDSDGDSSQKIDFVVPKDLASGYINNKKETYKFRFSKIFEQKTTQDEVFENVAQPVVDNVLRGYNGTIFAYGQTGSGKTFTITGGPERYADRGIIPRTLSYMFEHYQASQTEFEFTTHVSYLEIYNESGYDLLDPTHEATKLEDLPKVTLMEDADQNVHLKHLTTHLASSEEEALNLLFLGDTNRMIAETPMNQASTRSHCIFTVHVTSREQGSATIRRSKLHLVDLAGSERVSKTGVSGVLLKEAKYINLSLHYLEQVIVALAEKTRQHIPYRNSMMTSVLRDSLGGNSLTSMIATLSVEKKNIDESISTCRFAQRVAMIKNDAILNEELDPKLMIAKLKREVVQLKEELAMVTGEQRSDSLTEDELQRCHIMVEDYLNDRDPDAVIPVTSDMRKIQECFRLIKVKYLERPSSGASTVSTIKEDTSSDLQVNSAQLNKLRELIQQRDTEINILVNMLKKEKKKVSDAENQLRLVGKQPLRSPSEAEESYRRLSMPSDSFTDNSSYKNTPSVTPSTPNAPSTARKEQKSKKILSALSQGRQEAFEVFRRDYADNHTIEETKDILRNKYMEAKQFGQVVNSARGKINKLKTSIEQHRMMSAMQGSVDTENPGVDEMETEMRNRMEHEKATYKETFQKLKTLKTEIEHLQHLLEKAKVKLMKDFELWWAEQVNETQENGDYQKQIKPHRSKSRLKSAWHTPPSTQENRAARDETAKDAHRSSERWDTHSQSSGYSSRTTDSSSLKPASNTSSIPLTGDAQADADIMAFLKARQNILQKVQGQIKQ